MINIGVSCSADHVVELYGACEAEWYWSFCSAVIINEYETWEVLIGVEIVSGCCAYDDC